MKSQVQTSRRVACLVTVGLLVCSGLFADRPAPPRAVCDPSEVLWFDTAGTEIVAAFADGTVGCWDVQTGRRDSTFKLKDLAYPAQLHLSGGVKPCLARVSAEDMQDRTEGVVALFALPDGEQKQNVRIKDCSFHFQGLGFSRDGKAFYCNDFMQESVLSVDLEAGKVGWRSEHGDSVVIESCIRSDGCSYAEFFSDGAVVTRDDKGTVIWRSAPLMPPDTIEPLLAQPDGPSDVVLVYKDDARVLATLSLLDGKTLWSKRDVDIDWLRASTRDRKKLAVFEKGKLVMMEPPDGKSIEVEAVTEEVDAVFSTSGDRLLCLPALRHVGEDKKANTYTVARASRILKIVDGQTGKLVKSIELKRP